MAEEAQAATTYQRPSKVVLEVGNERNETILFAPNQERLRGRFNVHNMGPNASSTKLNITSMPPIPGVHLSLDLRNGIGSITDPLSRDPELVAKCSSVMQGALGRDIQPRPDVVQDGLDDDGIASWLYWMMRMVNGGNARVIEGEIPRTEKDIRRVFPKAKIRKDFYQSTPNRE